MSLLALAYPTLSAADYERIQSFRKLYDRNYRLVEPHFTLVFGVPDWEAEAFIAEIDDRQCGFQAFDFCLCCAVLNRDASGDLYHVFLTPDAGYSQVVRLHDRLYSGKLLPHRRLDIDFIPHIGIANSNDPRQCLEWIESWNREEFEIRGRVSALDVVRYEDDTVKSLRRIPLADK